MEVTVSQWNEAENEVEEAGLKRKQDLHRRSSSSNKGIEVEDTQGSAINCENEFSGSEGGGLELDESEKKENFFVIRTQVNAEMILQHEDFENSTILPASDPPLPEDSTSLNNVTTETGTVSIMNENEQERQELYLESVFQKPQTHGFYCPNCNSCIQKVYIQKDELIQPSDHTQPLQTTDPIRCSSCFSFLIPIGSWLFSGWVSAEDGALNDQEPEDPKQTVKGASQQEAPEPDQSVEEGTTKSDINIAGDSGKQTLHIIDEMETGPQKVASEVKDKINGTGFGSIPVNSMKSQDSSKNLIATSKDNGKGQVAPKKKQFWNDWAVIGGASESSVPKKSETDSTKSSDWRVIAAAPPSTIPKQPQTDFPDTKLPELVEVKVEPSPGLPEQEVPAESTPLLTRREPPVPATASTKKLEILKSIVYGGLTESLASLSVVTSAASAGATTLNIVALAIANLIGGLFALGHNLGELKAEQPKRVENDTPVDRYNELLGQRENFILHAFIAILSFIVFGLVPPLVYGFSFRESNDKDFKLVAVAGASLLCITLLSIAKAYIQRSNNYLTYLQTVLYYLSTAAVASVLCYLAGDLVKKLVEKLGWFDSASNFSLQIPGISVQQHGLESY
ncbi:membrane protein of ER body-like protein [Gastrolobium bilobum]|uniref:membrane protein of ER body-like protein n=1 Tax=Gastrolobium bilobum TaxID=150636 RepID=UPI002AB1436B|nr:membrane protein of ER body-like protein [Gastrolobium bilobum]